MSIKTLLNSLHFYTRAPTSQAQCVAFIWKCASLCISVFNFDHLIKCPRSFLRADTVEERRKINGVVTSPPRKDGQAQEQAPLAFLLLSSLFARVISGTRPLLCANVSSFLTTKILCHLQTLHILDVSPANINH